MWRGQTCRKARTQSHGSLALSKTQEGQPSYRRSTMNVSGKNLIRAYSGMRALTNTRGAAFLLAVYLSALMLLLLGGVSLQRTSTEVHAAQVYRDAQQAFWLSEGALDSMIVKSQNQPLHSRTSYPVASLIGTSTFSAMPVYAEISNNNTNKNGRILRHQVDLYQTVTKKVTGIGTVNGNISQQSSVYITETGPLRGIWANGTIAISGGRDIPAKDVFLSGDLYSSLGSVVSTIKENGVIDRLDFEGLINVPADAVAGKTGDSLWNAQLDYWKGAASPELKSIKEGYKIIQGMLSESRAKTNGSYSKVGFVTGPATGSSDHVDGVLSVGIMASAGIVDSRQCTTTFQLTSGKVIVDNGFKCDKNSSNTPGLECDKKTEDRNRHKDEIIMCGNALVPTDDLWFKTLIDDPKNPLDEPPHVIFRQPTTILLTGGAHRSTADQHFYFPLIQRDVFTNDFANIVQTHWNVALGAKVSGLDALGRPVPVDIMQANVAKKRDAVDPGIIFMKPGDQFQGSIYAPASLVILRARNCGDSCTTPLDIDYVVGDEVAIELESDHVGIGQTVAENADGATTTTGVLSWSAH